MDLDLIERLIELVGRSPIREFELSQDGWRLRLVKAAGSHPRALPPRRREADASQIRPSAASTSRGPHVIAAGMVGTFYRGAAPDKPPFVTVGDAVEDGQTLGLLEAMKTLIPVAADGPGRVAAILREDGTSVQAGDPLFTIDPTDPT